MNRSLVLIVFLLLGILSFVSVYGASSKNQDPDFLINKGLYKSLRPPVSIKDITKKVNVIRIRYSSEEANSSRDEFQMDEYQAKIDSDNIVEFISYKGISSRFSFSGPRFKTDRGIRIGDTLAKVKKRYPDGESDYSIEGGLSVFVRSENLIFLFNTDGIDPYDKVENITDKILSNMRLQTIVLLDLQK